MVTLNRNIKSELNAQVTNPNPSLGAVGVAERHQHGRHEYLEPVPDDDTTDDNTEDGGDDGGEPDSDEVEQNSK